MTGSDTQTVIILIICCMHVNKNATSTHSLLTLLNTSAIDVIVNKGPEKYEACFSRRSYWVFITQEITIILSIQAAAIIAVIYLSICMHIHYCGHVCIVSSYFSVCVLSYFLLFLC